METSYQNYYLAIWDKGANDCTDSTWPCVHARASHTSVGMLPVACARSAFYAFGAPGDVEARPSTSSNRFSSIDAIVDGGFPSHCRVPLRNGQQEGAVACIEELLLYVCSKLLFGISFPCQYKYIFVNTNVSGSGFADGHRGYSLKRAEDNWVVVVA
uniref:Uncharacterized protein n=1 Tax=Alexandrium catenella TaxID=2925 RepID=A0A7S1WKW3_ALECA